MALREIRTYPDPVLRQKAQEVTEINGSLQKLIDDMIETMHKAPGIGLAAPQVGESVRLIVVDISHKEEGHPLIVLVNPEIIETDKVIDSEEGCLSVPGYYTTIKRHGKVLVKGLDREGKPVEIEAEGLLARVLQHEIDHLNGILFIDHLSPIKKEFFKKRYKRMLQAR